MKLLFKQRLFSWLDSYNVYDENESIVFTVKGVLAFKHCFKIFDAGGNEVGMIREKVLVLFRPHFDLIVHGAAMGSIIKEIGLFRPRFTLHFRNWRVQGDWLEWNYQIQSPRGAVAKISKRLFRWTDTYEIDVQEPEDALEVLMVVVAIDAVKCSKDK